MADEKKKYRFNLIDLIVIIVILGVIGFCAYKMSSFFTEGKSTERSYTVTMEMKRAEKSLCENFSVGDVIYSRTTDGELGVITNITIKQSKDYTYSKDSNEMVEVELPEYCDVIFEITLNTSANDIGIGRALTFKTNKAIAAGYLLSVESAGQEK